MPGRILRAAARILGQIAETPRIVVDLTSEISAETLERECPELWGSEDFIVAVYRAYACVDDELVPAYYIIFIEDLPPIRGPAHAVAIRNCKEENMPDTFDIVAYNYSYPFDEEDARQILRCG